MSRWTRLGLVVIAVVVAIGLLLTFDTDITRAPDVGSTPTTANDDPLATLVVEAVTIPESGRSALVPQGWQPDPDDPGTFIDPISGASTTQQHIVAPGSGFVLPIVFQRIGAGILQPVAEMTTRGDSITWRIYAATVEDEFARFAIADGNGVYFVLVSGPVASRQTLVNALFVPAVEHFAPPE